MKGMKIQLFLVNIFKIVHDFCRFYFRGWSKNKLFYISYGLWSMKSHLISFETRPMHRSFSIWFWNTVLDFRSDPWIFLNLASKLLKWSKVEFTAYQWSIKYESYLNYFIWFICYGNPYGLNLLHFIYYVRGHRFRWLLKFRDTLCAGSV